MTQDQYNNLETINPNELYLTPEDNSKILLQNYNNSQYISLDTTESPFITLGDECGYTLIAGGGSPSTASILTYDAPSNNKVGLEINNEQQRLMFRKDNNSTYEILHENNLNDIILEDYNSSSWINPQELDFYFEQNNNNYLQLSKWGAYGGFAENESSYTGSWAIESYGISLENLDENCNIYIGYSNGSEDSSIKLTPDALELYTDYGAAQQHTISLSMNGLYLYDNDYGSEVRINPQEIYIHDDSGETILSINKSQFKYKGKDVLNGGGGCPYIIGNGDDGYYPDEFSTHLLWIDTDPIYGGLKYYNQDTETWEHVPVAYT